MVPMLPALGMKWGRRQALVEQGRVGHHSTLGWADGAGKVSGGHSEDLPLGSRLGRSRPARVRVPFLTEGRA